MTLKMDIPDLHRFLEKTFPEVDGTFRVDRLAPMELDVTLLVQPYHLRPGGTVSGPSMFGLADVGAYLTILAMIGPKALTVTTNASIDFMRKPVAHENLVAQCRLLKLGRSLAVTDCLIYSAGTLSTPVARANLTYAIPPVGSAADVDMG
ncbi:MAG: PaaI family thioesterase [Pseudomonadota bacterium]